MKTLGSVLLAALLVCAMISWPSLAADYPALPDGGSLVASTDGGTFITVDTAQVNDWVMTIRCTSSAFMCPTPSPRVYYRLSADAGTASSANQLLEVDRTFDLPVFQASGQKVRWLSLRGEDGGAPCCNVQQQGIP